MLRRAFFHGYGSRQALRRIGQGQCAWRHPGVFWRDATLHQIGYARTAFQSEREYRTMRRLARTAYAARVLGSLWAEVQRAG